MKKCIVATDSFKGTMTAIEVCDIISDELHKYYPECEILNMPIADGGEGTVDCFLRVLNGEKVFTAVSDAFGNDIPGYYGRFNDLAVIEMAAVAGIVSNSRRDPAVASTYGVGQLINHAVSSGCSTILLGLGGSCTNDAGTGMAAALGTVFTDSRGVPFVPAGGTLDMVCGIDNSETKRKLEGVTVCCMYDTTATMFGPEGAAYVYAAQKGAGPEQVEMLDKNLETFSAAISRELGIDVSSVAGSGAAGAMGAGAVAFMNADLRRGIDVILELVKFDECVNGCDCVFTGEGCMDSQSLSGKAVSGVAARAGKAGVPVIAVVGSLREEKVDSDEMGLSQVIVTAKPGQSFEQIKQTCRDDLRKAIDEFAIKQESNQPLIL